MTGIFPSNGVAAGNTSNALTGPDVTSNTEPKWYAERCNPRLNAAAMNAVMSELLNATKDGGVSYDAAQMTNLATAIRAVANEVVEVEIGTLMAAAGLTYNASSNTNIARAVAAIVANGGPVNPIPA